MNKIGKRKYIRCNIIRIYGSHYSPEPLYYVSLSFCAFPLKSNDLFLKRWQGDLPLTHRKYHPSSHGSHKHCARRIFGITSPLYLYIFFFFFFFFFCPLRYCQINRRTVLRSDFMAFKCVEYALKPESIVVFYVYPRTAWNQRVELKIKFMGHAWSSCTVFLSA